MILKIKRRPTFREKMAQLAQWHRFFALFPRRVSDSELVWLSWVERRNRNTSLSFPSWEYRKIADQRPDSSVGRAAAL